MVMPAGLEPKNRGARLADPGLRRDVEAAVKRRVRGHDADDVVQAALADVLSAARVPEDAEEFRRFVFAVSASRDPAPRFDTSAREHGIPRRLRRYAATAQARKVTAHCGARDAAACH